MGTLTKWVAPQAWQGLFERLESGEGGTLCLDLRFRNALEGPTGGRCDPFGIGKSAEDP